MDEGGSTRVPTFRDYDAERGPMVQAFESIAPEVHEEHRKEALAKFYPDSPAISAEVLGNHPRSIVIADSPEEIRAIEQAAARDAAAASVQAAEKASADALKSGTPDPSALTADSSASAADGSAPTGGTPHAEKPNSLESTLANIRLNGDRQRRLVIAGDPAIEKAFYEKLAARGQLYYQGGTPIITASRKSAIKLLQETASQFDGASASHALSLKLDREGEASKYQDGISNNLLAVAMKSTLW
jgi:hypothetical protein